MAKGRKKKSRRDGRSNAPTEQEKKQWSQFEISWFRQLLKDHPLTPSQAKLPAKAKPDKKR